MRSEPPSEASPRDQGIAALRAGDTARAHELLIQAVQGNPNDAIA